jgi:multimeric flavodoxin WrbA
MKILAISFSPRPKGSTMTLLGHALKGAQQEGAEIELFSVAGKNINPCQGCWSCRKNARCRQQDDMTELYDRMAIADGIIFGTPIYVYGMTSQAKIIMDRCVALSSPDRNLNNKVGGIVVTAGSIGIVDALKDWYYFMVTHRMLPANQVAVYPGASGREELQKMENCLQATFDLGRQMVVLAKIGFKYPAEFLAHSIAYGTHTK